MKIEYNMTGLAYDTQEGGKGVVSCYKNASGSTMVVICTGLVTGEFIVVRGNEAGSSLCTVPLKDIWQVNDLLQDFNPVYQFV